MVGVTDSKLSAVRNCTGEQLKTKTNAIPLVT
nr:MAG TPA: hypothetical protein [Caudoviricetes sp.]